jgi:polysaccharide pyruvyl transferase CsaB
MKVLHLIGGGDVGGAKIHVLSLVRELGKQIDVKLIALRPGEFADDAARMGINIEVVKSRNIISDIMHVIKIVREDDYDIVHSHGAKANMFAFFIRRRLRIPAVTTVHSDYRLDYLHSVLKRYSIGLIYMVALRFADYYVTVSERFRDMLIERRFSFENIYTVYNGMDFTLPVRSYDRNAFLARYGIEAGNNTVIAGILARLDPVKGVDVYIMAAALAIRENPDIIFLVGGDGEERKRLEKKAYKLGLKGRMFFLGWIKDSYEFLSCIDINVLSSFSETFPYSILEGVRVRRATISTNVGGIPDLIESGKNGLLFNPGDYKTLARHILELASNAQKRNDMAEKLFQKASSNYSLSNMTDTQMNIYRSILSRQHRLDKKPRQYDAILSGYYGFKNIGDDALLQAIIENLKMYRSDLNLTVLSSDPAEVKKKFRMNSINRVNICKIIRTMKKAKVFIYGGGTLIQESTSTRSLYYYLFMIWIARKLGLNVMLYANGIEPIKKYINRIVTRRIMNGVDLITLREKESLQELKKLRITAPEIEVTADAAIGIEPESAERVNDILRQEGIPDSALLIGFSARKWVGFKRDEERNAISVLAKLADFVVEKYGAVPVLIPMQAQDKAILADIARSMKHRGYIINGTYNVAEVLGLTGRMSLVIGMRLHSLVFSAAMGVPVIGLGYEPKVRSFLKYIGQESAYAGNVRFLELPSLLALVERVWSQREEIGLKLSAVMAQLKKKALRNAELASKLMEGK